MDRKQSESEKKTRVRVAALALTLTLVFVLGAGHEPLQSVSVYFGLKSTVYTIFIGFYGFAIIYK